MNKKSPFIKGKFGILLLSLALILTATVGGTIAYLIADTTPVVNTFTPANVDCEVTEDFDGTVKSNVNVTNTGNTDAYIRVKLISYRVNDVGQHIGGMATVPTTFTLGANWVKHVDGFYYYTLPVKPGQQPKTALTGSDSIALVKYTDADGGKQVIEVMAEAIQSAPDKAVGDAWGVTITPGNVAAYQPAGN